jgi:AraC-like DNA-binding protein/predicted transcriptional regulator YdeE
MNNFDRIKEALEYIDSHLDEQINFEILAKRFHFSPYYFHRMFSVIVGKTIAVYIRERRLLQACIKLSSSDESILEIGLECGFTSAQSFSRSFKEVYGLAPRDYRNDRYKPVVVTVEEMIMKFTNRLKGGMTLNPQIIMHESMMIAGVCGDGNKTWDVWNRFEALSKEKPLINRLSENGYEVRLYDGDKSIVHVGFAVSGEEVEQPYELFKLPATKYASFDVYVENGYESENDAMNEWLETNSEGYSEKLLGEKHYCVEYYDERFHGSEAGSIVEIWIPIEKKLV